jgi:nitrile hydratase accessory protein
MSERPALLPWQPRDEAGPVFREPWEAQAFAMTLALHEKGVFTWNEWARALSCEIAAARAAGDADLGDTYYRHWLAALEALIAEKGVSSNEELARHRRGWLRAAERTPHGVPIELRREDCADDSSTP